jgi:hypothetical protein
MRRVCLNPWLVLSLLFPTGCGRTPLDQAASSKSGSTGTGGAASQGGGTSGAGGTTDTVTAKGGSAGTTLSQAGFGGATGSYGGGAGNNPSGGCTGTPPYAGANACSCADMACAPPDQCHGAGACDATTGQCIYPSKNDGTACVSTNLCAGGTTIQPTSGTTITVGGFDASRGGDCSVATGSFLVNVRNRLVTANFPGVTFVLTGAPLLTPAYLATLDILVITSTSSNTSAITPLSQAEQEAVSAFIQGGGRFLISSDNATFGGANTERANNSILGPVGMTAGGMTLSGPMQSTVAGSPLVSGRAGSWSTIDTNVPGSWMSTGNATVVASINGNPSLPALAQFNVGDLGPASARGVAIADMNALKDFGGFNIVMIDNIVNYLIPTVQQVTAATQGNTCQSSVCVAGPATYCPPADACHLARVCDPMNGVCAPADQALDGTPCGNGGSCQGGVCQSR